MLPMHLGGINLELLEIKRLLIFPPFIAVHEAVSKAMLVPEH